MEIEAIQFSLDDSGDTGIATKISATEAGIRSLQEDRADSAFFIAKKQATKFKKMRGLIHMKHNGNAGRDISRKQGETILYHLESTAAKRALNTLKAIRSKKINGVLLFTVADQEFSNWLNTVAKQSTGSFPSAQPTQSRKKSARRSAKKVNPINPRMDVVDVPVELEHTYIGSSRAAMLTRQFIMHASPREYAVLVMGETGTGKDIIANAIHSFSTRNGPFVAVNCAAFPADKLESVLFGYTKGAYTGAATNKKGLWKEADNGTLFLDELGEMTLDHQSKMLRALDNGKIRPLGGSTDISVSARIVAATNQNMPELVKKGRFREDLFYRLREGAPIWTVPLRDKPEDIPLIIDSLWNHHAPTAPSLHPDILAYLQQLPWPGNVRDLKTLVDNLTTHFGNQVIAGSVSLDDVKFIIDFALSGAPPKTQPTILYHRYLKRLTGSPFDLEGLLKRNSKQKSVEQTPTEIIQLRVQEVEGLIEGFQDSFNIEVYRSLWSVYGDLQRLTKDIAVENRKTLFQTACEQVQETNNLITTEINKNLQNL